MVEASFGIGMLFGPILGAFLYSLGGYMVPFITFASLYLAVLPFIVFSLVRAKKIQPTDAASASALSTGKSADIEISVLAKKPRFIFGILSQMCVTMTL